MATYRNIARFYAWKGLFTDVANHCKKCQTCQARWAPRGQYPTLRRPVSDQPLHTVASDLSGSLGPPTGKEKYRYFVVFIDQLTKWPTVIPVKAPTTKQLIKAFEGNIMPKHGYMDTLISDQGPAYISKEY